MGTSSRWASGMAISSLSVSITNSRSGRPPISLMPPSDRSSELRSRVQWQHLLLSVGARTRPKSSTSSSCCSRRIAPEMVFQLVSVPPSQRGLMNTAPSAWRLRLCPRAPAAWYRRTALGRPSDGVGDRLQGAVQQHGLREVDDVDVVAGTGDAAAIFGFQRCVWWPKWTPASKQLTHIEIG